MNNIFEDGNENSQVYDETADSPAREEKRRNHRNAQEKREKRAERLERSSSRRAAGNDTHYPPVHPVYDNGPVSMAAPFGVQQDYGSPVKITPPDMDAYSYDSNPQGYVPYPGEKRESYAGEYGFYGGNNNEPPFIQNNGYSYEQEYYQPQPENQSFDRASYQPRYGSDDYIFPDEHQPVGDNYGFAPDTDSRASGYPYDGNASHGTDYVRAAGRPSYSRQSNSRTRHQNGMYPYHDNLPAGNYPPVRAVQPGEQVRYTPRDAIPNTTGMRIVYQSPDYYKPGQGTQPSTGIPQQQIPVIVPKNAAIEQHVSSRAPQRTVRTNPTRQNYRPRYEADRPSVNEAEIPHIDTTAGSPASLRVTTSQYNGTRNFERDIKRAENTDFSASGIAVSSVAAPPEQFAEVGVSDANKKPLRRKPERQIPKSNINPLKASSPSPEEYKIGQDEGENKKKDRIIKPAFVFPEDFDDDEEDEKAVRKKEKQEKKERKKAEKASKSEKSAKTKKDSEIKEAEGDKHNAESDNSEKKNEKKDLPTSEKARITVLIVSLVVAFGSIVYLGYQMKLKIDNRRLEQEFSVSAQAELTETTKKKSQKTNDSTYEAEQTTISDEEYFAQLRAENPDISYPVGLQAKYAPYYTQNQDFVGYISIEGLGISLPVVQGDDDEKYLKRNFYGQSTKYGCPFVMHLNNIELMDQNTVIYGHYMRDGSVFAALHDYKSIDGYKKAPVITFNTIYNDYKWKIIAVIITNTYAKDDNDYFFRYYFTNLSSEENFNDYITALRARSLYSTGTDVLPTDKLLTLSTCAYEFSDARLVVVARMVRPGETAKVDTSLATVNRNPKFPQAYYDKKNKKNPFGTMYNWYPDI